MHRKILPIVRSLGRLAALALIPACLAGLGCAGSALADFDSERPVTKKAAADDSFPSAAEVGLTADADKDSPDDAKTDDAKTP